jgi:hypothetical protein
MIDACHLRALALGRRVVRTTAPGPTEVGEPRYSVFRRNTDDL